MWTLKHCELIRDGGSYTTTLTDGMHEVSLWLQVDRGAEGARQIGDLFFARGESAAPMFPDTQRVPHGRERAWLDTLRGAAARDDVDERTRAHAVELIEILAQRMS